MKIHSNFLNQFSQNKESREYELRGTCPISGKSFEHLVTAQQAKNRPYVLAFAESANHTLSPYDGVAWYEKHSARPQGFFENNTATKVHLLALVTLADGSQYSSHLGAITKEKPEISDYVQRYILATSSDQNIQFHLWQLLRHDLTELDSNEICQFAEARLACRPANTTALNALKDLIRQTTAPAKAYKYAQTVAAIAHRVSSTDLYEAIFDALTERADFSQLRAASLPILKQWLHDKPGSSLALISLALTLMPDFSQHHKARGYFMRAKARDPDCVFAYWGLAWIIFANPWSLPSDIQSAKEYLETFLRLGFQKKYPESIKRHTRENAYAMIRANRTHFSTDEIRHFVAMIGAAKTI